MPFEMSDSATIEGAVRRTRDGYLVANVRAGRAGVQHYSGVEIGKPSMKEVRIFRPEEEVFDTEAMATAAHRPVTLGHPPQAVNAENWRDVAIGQTGGDVVRDGGFLRIPLCLMDASAIGAVEAGTQQLSWGYTCELDFTPGKTADGQDYDAVQRGIRINHLAVVDAARAGPECRIGDTARNAGSAAATTVNPPPPATTGDPAVADEMRTVVVDGLSIATTVQGAEIVSRLQRQVADAAAQAEAHRTDHAKAITALDGQVAALRTEVTRLKDGHQGEIAAINATHQQALAKLQGEADVLRAQTSDAALDARVTARTTLVTQARRVLGDSYDATGRSDIQVRRDVVAKALPSLPIADDKPEAYVQAAYDSVMASPSLSVQVQQTPDPLRQAPLTAGGFTPNQQTVDSQQPSSWELNRRRLEAAYLNAGKVA